MSRGCWSVSLGNETRWLPGSSHCCCPMRRSCFQVWFLSSAKSSQREDVEAKEGKEGQKAGRETGEGEPTSSSSRSCAEDAKPRGVRWGPTQLSGAPGAHTCGLKPDYSHHCGLLPASVLFLTCKLKSEKNVSYSCFQTSLQCVNNSYEVNFTASYSIDVNYVAVSYEYAGNIRSNFKNVN